MAELKAKIAAVIKRHGEIDVENEQNDISAKDTCLFASCQRWHENAHMTDEDWICHFEQIREKLKIEGSRLVNPPEDIINMLTSSYKEDSSPQSMFGINDMFSIKFQSHLRKVFEELVDERDGDDEFGLDNIYQGWKPDDVTFWSRTFMPVAMFYSYKHRHTYATDQELFSDCFSVGAGSRRDDLIPEVNAFCNRCSADQMGSKNKKIFLEQLKNHFNLPDYREESIKGFAVSDISDGDTPKSVASENLYEQDKKIFNPLLSESSESDHDHQETENCYQAVFNPMMSDSSEGDSSENLDYKISSEEELKPYKCFNCLKAFSKEKFVQMHSSIFHQRKNKVVVPEFVKEPLEMMTSFSIENRLNTNDTEDMLRKKQSQSNEEILQRKQKSSIFKKRKLEGMLRVQPKRGKVSKSENAKIIKKALFFDE